MDYFKVCADEIRTHKICSISSKSHEDVTLFTESGYLMLVKSFTDDLAWQVQRQLVKVYFKAKELISAVPALALPNFTDPAEAAIAWAAEYKAKQAAQAQVLQLEHKVDELSPKARALDSIANANGLKTIPQAAKPLGGTPSKTHAFPPAYFPEYAGVHHAHPVRFHRTFRVLPPDQEHSRRPGERLWPERPLCCRAKGQAHYRRIRQGC